ncbi:MAG: PLxRFG domain-containing protein [Rhodobacteraceae bacterium]|nr:PLxRFG domain-containing protein [Paracoccaceae bacterium]
MFNILDRDNPEKNRGTFGQIEDEARRTGVPVNVLLAIGEKAGVNDPDELLEVTRAAAAELGPAIAEGANVKDVIRGLAGNQSDAFLARAREIGETLYPDRMAAARAARAQQTAQQAEDQPGVAGSLGRQLGGALVAGTGAAVEGVGQLADAPLHVLRGDADYEPGLTARLGRAGGDFLRDLGNDMRGGVSDDAKLAIQQSMPSGNLFKPSTWSMGEDPSPYGYALLAADVLGSFLPVVAAGIVTGGAGAAVVGGAQSAGGGAELARQVVEEAFSERDASGVSALERESGYFRELRAAGMSEEEAFEQAKDAAGFVSALLTAPIGALGGATTTAIMRGALPAGVGQTGGALRQGTTRAAIGGLEEGFQEAVEGVAARFGTQVATDMEVDLAEDTFADFLMGALGGAPVGGVAGALQGAGAGRENDEMGEGAGVTTPGDPVAPVEPPLSQQAQPVEPPAKPGSMAAARQEGARRTTPQPDTGAEMVSPQPGMPGAQPQPPEAGPVAASAPQPQSGGTGQQIPATLEFRGDIAPENVVIVGETETGIQLMDPETGEIGEIARADIEAGIVTLTPRDDVVTGRPADAAAVPGEAIPPEIDPNEYDLAVQEMGEIAGNLTSVGQAERTLADIDGIAREFGEGEDLRAIRSAIEAYIEQQEAQRAEADALARADESLIETPKPGGDVQPDQSLGVLGQGVEPDAAPAVSPDTIARPDGTPFKSANALRQKITRDGIDPATYDIVERNGGFVAVAKPQEDTDAGMLDDVATGDQANAAGRSDQQEEGQEAAQADRGERPDQSPSPDGTVGVSGVSGPAQTGEPTPALNAAPEPTPDNFPFSDSETGGPGAQARSWLSRAPDDVILNTPNMGLSENWLRTERQRRKIGEYAEPTPTEGEQTDGIQQGQQEGLQQQGREEEVTPGDQPTVTVEDIRERAAILRGLPKDRPPQVDGVSIKWDERQGGFIFSRKHKDKVLEAAYVVEDDMAAEAAKATGNPVRKATPEQVDLIRESLLNADGRVTTFSGGEVAIGDQRIDAREYDAIVDQMIAEGVLDEDGKPKSGGTADQIEQAAAETDPNPTPAQAEAENYKTGKADWRGLKLSIENRKGGTRSKINPDGTTAWSVTMPAHYGRILRTEGADGDHVDFYMGDNPDSDRVFVVDQKDAETGSFDEHKVMLGFNTQKEAKDAYLAGFSDGKGAQRWGGVTAMSVADLGQIIGDKAKWQKPMKMAVETVDSRDNGLAVRNVNINVVGADGKTDAERGEPLKRTMTTDDGYRVEWDEKGTTIFHPRGPGIRSTMRRLTDAEVNEYLDSVRVPEVDAGIQAKFPAKYQAKVTPESSKVSPGYDRVMVNGEPGTDQERMTSDGFVVKRKVNETVVLGPDGSRVYTGPHDATEGTVNRAIKIEREKSQKLPARANDWWRSLHKDQRTTALGEAGFLGREWADLTTEERVEIFQGTADSVATQSTPATSKPKAETEKPAPGILGALSQEKQDRAAELKRRLAEKARNQTSSGLDPEYITLGGELVALYVEAGTKRFAQMLADFAESTGLTMRQAQAPMRAAYNHVRDEMDLNGEDVSEFDTADQVMAEIRKAFAAETENPTFAEGAEPDTVPDATATEGNQDDQRSDASPDRTSAREGEGNPASGQGQADGTRRGSDAAGSAERGPEPSQERSSSGSDAARDGATGRSGRADEQLGARDHVIEAGGLTLARGEKTHARESIAALRVLRTIQAEGRPATADERAALAKYGGAGTLSGTLPNEAGKIRFPDLAAEIDALLSPEEKATLSRTSQYAFYTAESALRGMWSLARQLGFSGGRVYEPGMGVGGFAGTKPGDIRAETSYQGLELDLVTAQIAQALYPRQTIQQGDFTKTPLPQNYYDMVIGNPPFSRTQIQNDPAYPQRFMIHDYFFAKSIDAVRPGGLLMFITSAGTMNKSDTKARDYLADRADLVGAIRLPNTAFKLNGTEVTTDIIVLRKRIDGETEANPSWRESVKTDLPDGKGGTGQAFVNRYFLDNPDMILGEQGLFDKLTAGARVGVRPLEGADLGADIARAAQAFPRDVMSDAAPSTELGAVDSASPETKRGGFYIKDGVLHQFDGNAGVEVGLRSKENPKGIPKADHERIMGLVPIKMALRDVYAADLDGKDASEARAALNKAYDAFVKRFGPINKEVRTERAPSRVQLESARQRAAEDARSRGEPFDIGSFDAGPMIEAGAKMADIARARAEAMERPGYREGDFDPRSVPETVIVKRPNIDPFLGNKDRLGDQEGYRLRSIEKVDKETGEVSKAAIFTEPAVRKTKKPQINSPEDALLYTLAERGRIDVAAIAKLAGVSEESALEDLKGKIFKNQESGQYETRAKYLSGNVRRKLKEAEAAAKFDPSYSGNVRELMDVQPEPIPASDIRVPVGAHWFDPVIYGQYARSKGLQLTASFKRSLGIWTVDGDTKSAAARNDWGTEDLPFADLMRLVMNNKSIQVRRTRRTPEGGTESFLDEEATQAAQDKAQEIRSDFSDWFWSDEARASEMEALYNETFNAEVAPQYDGGYLTTPGVNSGWDWRPHQSGVIARILQSGNTYMAHTVGAGKTSAMIGAGMEARRLGLARKPMYVVPNHMLDQFSKEFYEQYPLANVAIADESRFHTSRRKEFVADIAMNDYDAVVITHSAFELIPPSEAAVTLAVQDMLKDVREVYDSTSAGERGLDQALLGSIKSIAGSLGVDVKQVEGAKMNTRKKIEQLLEAAEQKIQRQTSTANKDQVFTFDEIGVDMMFVDEAHLFRKLSFATQNGNIKGIDPNGSAASMDLFIKTRVVDQNNPGRGLILASGTPITNTMAELFSLSRYIQLQALEERGVSSFDAWAATFGMTETTLEQDPAGGYKQVTRFSKFVNTPELSLMVRQVMDIVSGPDLEQYVTRPKLKGGKRNLVVVDPTPEVKRFQEGLAARMEIISQRKGPVQKGDDILLSVINDGRLAAIDMRLVDPASSGQGSKLETAIQNVYRKWKDGDNAPLHEAKREGGYSEKPVMRGPTTQIVFSTLGVNPSKHNPGFSVHRFMKSELIRMGVPANDIILAEELNSHGKRQRAFNDMNEGKKRILIGSKTLFTGVNAQKRIAAIHNLDPLWYPADDEQRNGRGIRQGNMNPEIEIFDYSTKGTYDATMWQMMGRKAAFIEAFYRGDPTVREMEDLGEASQFEQAKAMTTADPRVQILTDMKAERDTLSRRKNALVSQRRRLDQQEKIALRTAEIQEAELPVWEALAARVIDTKGDAFSATVGDQTYDNRSEAGNALISAADNLLADPDGPVRQDVGMIGGLPVQIRISRAAQTTTFVVPTGEGNGIDVGWSIEPVGMVRRIENATQGLKEVPEKMRADIAEYREKAAGYAEARSRLKDFADQAKLDELEDKISDLESEMLSEADDEKQSRFNQEPVASLRGDELGDWSDIRQLGRKVEAWYRDNLIGTSVTNAETGMDIQFNRRGAKKVSGRKGDELLRIVPALREILANGSLVASEGDKKGRDEVVSVHKFQANVDLAGKPVTVIATVREMSDGTFHYDLSKEAYGARVLQDNSPANPTVEPDGPTSAFEGDPAEFNLDFAGNPVNASEQQTADPEIKSSDIAAIKSAVGAELRRAGLDGAVAAQVVRGLSNVAGVPIQGRQRGAQIEVNPDSADGALGTLRHEIVHALRDAGLWGKPYGLFTRAEWQGMVAAARADRALMARIESMYPDLNQTARMEEGVAELYRLWARNADQRSGLDAAFQKIRAFFQAMANAFRGQGFQSAAMTFERIARGDVGGRGPDEPGGSGTSATERDMSRESRFDPARRPDGKFASKAAEYSRALLGDSGKVTGTKERGLMGQILTDAMGGKSDKTNLLALVPGEPLMRELAKNIRSAQKYLNLKHDMSAMKNNRQAVAAGTAEKWGAWSRKNGKSNDRMMALMHDATIAGLDPAEPFTVRPKGTNEGKAAYAAFIDMKKREYEELRKRWDMLPSKAHEIYREVRDAYREVADTERGILLDNVAKAMEINLKKAQRKYDDRIREIEEEGLTGDAREAAVAEAKERLAQVKKRDGYGRKARLNNMRLMFEQNEVPAPYFPLMRHGNYYVTLKNADGKIESFSKFESARQRDQAAAELRREYPEMEVKIGTMPTGGATAGDVDPTFVAEVEALLGASNPDPALMDAIWQKYLESLPDLSMRKSRIHRKGTPGYSSDAFRNFSHQMFHSATQLARLKYGQDMRLALDDAHREADESADPDRAQLVVNEMEKRHDWVMNPQSSAWSTVATTAAFIYYLGATPGAALVNLSQTVVVGVPVLAAAFEKGTVAGAGRQLSRALRQFGQSKGNLLRSKHLSDEEKVMLKRAHDEGVVEKTQNHDLTNYAESGIAYNDRRQKVMGAISWMFHQAEVLNREITFIAALRMAKENGMHGEQAYQKAKELDYKVHFDYQSESRPRLQFNDWVRVFTIFRNYQLNMLFRLFRDLHQSFNGESEADRREARAQLIGISGMMMIMAGVTGTWGYALLTTLAGMFLPGGADEAEEEVKEAIVNLLGRDLGGALLKGVPGHATGVDLSSRMGMPELWFRRPDRQQEGQDLYNHWLEQLLGPAAGIVGNQFRAYQAMKEGEWVKGFETAVPKAIRDVSRSIRYSQEGVTTWNGNPIIEDVSPTEALTQALGFTPARVSERYEVNRFMKNEEMRIRGQRTRLMGQAYDEIKTGGPLSDRTKRAIAEFNAEYPSYPITADTLRASFRARARGETETVDGVRINSRLDAQIREDRAPYLYQ